MRKYRLSPVEEGVLRAHIKLMLHESQGATTQTVIPATGNVKPFKLLAGVALGSGMDAFRGAMGVVDVWAGSNCRYEQNWPMASSTAIVESGANFSGGYADAVQSDIVVRCVGVIHKCRAIAESWGNSATLTGVTGINKKYPFTRPASSTLPSSPQGTDVRGDADVVWGEILTAMSKAPATGCNFSTFVNQFQSRSDAIPRLKLIADAAYQGAVSQLTAHSSAPNLPANITVNGVNKPTVAYITSVIQDITAVAKTDISKIK
jgi:hypothetical protein